MKITSNLSKNFFLHYSEGRGVAQSKKRILKEKKDVSSSYFCQILYVCCFFFVAIVLGFVFHSTFSNFLLFLLLMVYLVVSFSRCYSSYAFRKSTNFENTIYLDETGLTDYSFYGIQLTFRWDKVVALVETSHTVVILTDTPIYFFFDSDTKPLILKAIKKYGAKPLIIEKKKSIK